MPTPILDAAGNARSSFTGPVERAGLARAGLARATAPGLTDGLPDGTPGGGNPYGGLFGSPTPDFLHDQLRSELFPQPYTAPGQLDPFREESDELRQAYRTVHSKVPTIRAAVDGLAKAVACLDVAVNPLDKDNADDRRAAEYVKWAVGASRKGWDGLILDLARGGLIDGWAAGEIKLDATDRSPVCPRQWRGLWGLEHVRSLDTSRLRLQLDVYRNVTGVISLVTGQTRHEPEKVVLFTYDDLYSNPYGQSAIRAAYKSAQFIEDGYKLWWVLLRNTSGPVVVGKNSQPQMRKQFEAALDALRTAGWIVTGKDDEIELLDFAAASNFQAFEQKVRICREEIYLAIRGAYLPFTEGGKSGGDTRGDSETSKAAGSDPTEQLLAKALGRVLTFQLAPRLVQPNFPPGTGCPIITLGGVSWGETKQQLEVLKSVQDLGVVISEQHVREISQTPAPVDAADALKPPSAQPPGLPGMGDDPFGGPPGGDPGPNPPPGGGGDGGPGDGSPSPADLGLEPPAEKPQPGTGDRQPEQFAAPPRAGLVPQSGDAEHPVRWVRKEGAPDSTSGPPKQPTPASGVSSGPSQGVLGKVRDLGDKLVNSKVGRLVQAVEHKLSIAAHKTREIAEQAARRRGFSPEQAARLKNTLAVADFLGGYVTGAAVGTTVSPAAGKAAALLPSVSALYLGYSTAVNPAATWKAALEVVRNSSLDPRGLLADLGAAWKGEHHFADAAAPDWKERLADLLAAEPATADWRQAVFLAGLVTSGDPEGAVDLAAQADPPGDPGLQVSAGETREAREARDSGTPQPSAGTADASDHSESRASQVSDGRPATLPTAALRADPDRFQFRPGADGSDGTVRDLPDERFDPQKAGRLAVWYDPIAGRPYVVDGHHRLAWAKRDGVPSLPVEWVDAPTADAAKADGVVRNLSRFARDDNGAEHRGKGPGGGQFAPKGGGGEAGGGGEKKGQKPAPAKEKTGQTNIIKGGKAGPRKASAKEHEAAKKQAQAKIAAAPVPPPEKVAKMRAALERAKTDPKARAGGDARGSSADRKARARNLFKEFGGEERGYVVCHGTGQKMHWTDDPELNPHGYPKFEQGKIFTAHQGGGYQLPNLLPESFDYNRSRNDKTLRPENLK